MLLQGILALLALCILVIGLVLAFGKGIGKTTEVKIALGFYMVIFALGMIVLLWSYWSGGRM